MARSRDFRKIREEGKWKKAVQAYLASISFADEQVGRVLDAISESPFRENTIVVFWSDHGWHLGTKKHWHKQTLWEECTQIPFVIDIPWSDQSPFKCDKPVDMVNVFPTLVSLCNLPPKNDLDGHDMSPLLQQVQPEWDYPALTEIKTGNMSVRSENWH